MFLKMDLDLLGGEVERAAEAESTLQWHAGVPGLWSQAQGPELREVWGS